VVVRLPGAVARGADEHAADSPRLARVGPQHLAHYEQNVHCIFLKPQPVPCEFIHLHSLAEDHLSNSGHSTPMTPVVRGSQDGPSRVLKRYGIC
jgi:hypothetical protein